MQNAPGMGVLNCTGYFSHQRRGTARLAAQNRPSLDEAAASGKLHAEEWKLVFALAHFINGQNIWMIKMCRRLRFAPETLQRLMRIRVIGKDALQRNDAARVPLPRAINNAHPATPDFFQNLIIAQSPIGILHGNFTEYILERLYVVDVAVLTCPRRDFLIQALGEQTAQAKSVFNPRSRAALRTGDWFFLDTP